MQLNAVVLYEKERKIVIFEMWFFYQIVNFHHQTRKWIGGSLNGTVCGVKMIELISPIAFDYACYKCQSNDCNIISLNFSDYNREMWNWPENWPN